MGIFLEPLGQALLDEFGNPRRKKKRPLFARIGSIIVNYFRHFRDFNLKERLKTDIKWAFYLLISSIILGLVCHFLTIFDTSFPQKTK